MARSEELGQSCQLQPRKGEGCAQSTITWVLRLNNDILASCYHIISSFYFLFLWIPYPGHSALFCLCTTHISAKKKIRSLLFLHQESDLLQICFLMWRNSQRRREFKWLEVVMLKFMWNWLCYRVLGLNVILEWVCDDVSRWDLNWISRLDCSP